MKVLVTGATGFVGRRIAKELLREGHSLSIVSRDADRAKASLGLPGDYHRWDPEKAPPPAAALEGVGAIVHLAGEGVAEARWTVEQKRKIRDSRVVGTRNLAAAVARMTAKPKVVVCASAIGYYGDRGDETLTEESAIGRGFLADICRDWEAEAQKMKSAETRVANVRVGAVLEHDGGAMKKLLPLFKSGLAGPVGSGKQWMSWIHMDDVVGIFMLALGDARVTGPINATAPNPVTNEDLSKAIAQAVHRPAALRAPAFALKLAMGEMASVALDSERVLPKRATELGYRFKFTDVRAAIGAVVEKKSPDGLTGIIHEEQWVPLPVEKVFPFYCDEKNLERLTPPWLGFRVVGKSTAELRPGTIIDYKLKVHGVPVRWRTRIEEWEENRKFVDNQLKGPYALWHHTHLFEPLAGGTLVTDHVRYRVPMGRLGKWFGGALVRADVRKIFGYRRRVVAEMFGGGTPRALP